jgi:hypothetical protein
MVAAVVLAGAGITVIPAVAAQAADGLTTVTPAGHNYTATLVPGSSAVFVVGAKTVTCDQSSTSGTVPAEPLNTAAGTVVAPLTPAVFANSKGDCPVTGGLFLTARTVGNSTNGTWTNGLTFDPAGSTGTLTIPQAGVVTTISLGSTPLCTVTVADKGPASITGKWTPGTATSLPVLDFSAGVSLPIHVSDGFGCPTTVDHAIFKAKYQIADTTDATQQVAVAAGVAPTPPATTDPTPDPTVEPTVEPTVDPTSDPTVEPTVDPTTVPDPTDSPVV